MGDAGLLLAVAYSSAIGPWMLCTVAHTAPPPSARMLTFRLVSVATSSGVPNGGVFCRSTPPPQITSLSAQSRSRASSTRASPDVWPTTAGEALSRIPAKSHCSRIGSRGEALVLAPILTQLLRCLTHERKTTTDVRGHHG